MLMKEIREALMQFDRDSPLETQVALLDAFTDALLKHDPSRGAPDLDPAWNDLAPEFLLRLIMKNGSDWQTLVSFHKLLWTPVPVAGGIAFCVENQGCHWWGFCDQDTLKDPDPMVWHFGTQKRPKPKLEGFKILKYLRERAWYDPKQPDPGPPREETRLCEFLLQLLVFEFASPGEAGLWDQGVGEKGFQQALGILKPLPLAPWSWPSHPTRFFQGESVFAFEQLNEDGTHFMHLGFDDKESRERFMEQVPDADWERTDDP